MDLQHIFFGFRKQIATWLKTWKWQSFWRTGHSFSADQMPLETSPLQNLNGPCHYMTSSSDQATTVSCDTQRWTQNLLKAMKKSMFNWIQWNSQSHMRALCRLNQMKNPSLPETLSFPGFESSGKLLLNPKKICCKSMPIVFCLMCEPGFAQATAFPPIKCHLKLHPCKTWMALAITWHHQVIKPPLSHVIPKDEHRIFWKQWRSQCSTESNETHNLTWKHYAGLIRWRIFMIKYSRARDLNEEETSCRPRDIVGDGIWVSYKIIGWVWTKWKYKIISGVMLSANRQATTSQSLKLLSLEGHTMMPNELILHWHAGQELFAIYLANDLPPHGLQCNNTYHLESPRDGQTSKIFQLVKINPTLTPFLQSHMPTTWISEKPSCSAHQSAGPQTYHWDSTAAQVAQNHASSRLPSDPRPAFTFGQGNGKNKWGFISHEASWYCKKPLSNALCFPNWMARNFITWWSSKWSHMTLKPPSILSICILLAFPILQNQKHPKLRKQTLPNNSLRPTLNMFRELLSVLLDSETIVFFWKPCSHTNKSSRPKEYALGNVSILIFTFSNWFKYPITWPTLWLWPIPHERIGTHQTSPLRGQTWYSITWRVRLAFK